MGGGPIYMYIPPLKTRNLSKGVKNILSHPTIGEKQKNTGYFAICK